MSENAETAILAGGCFWGVEDLLRRRDGVIPRASDTPAGRTTIRPTRTILVTPRRSRSSSTRPHLLPRHPRVLLPDPRPDDKGPAGQRPRSCYRSEIFYTSDEQREIAEDTIADVDASGLWPGKVVTEISEAVPFWEAEPEHQDYLQRYPNGYTCHFPRPGWEASTPRDRGQPAKGGTLRPPDRRICCPRLGRPSIAGPPKRAA